MQRDESSGGRVVKIVDAAYRCFVRDGLANVSIKDIAKEAGVAPGLLHYYFASKEQLLVTVVREAARRYRDGFFEQLRQVRDPSQGLNVSIRWVEDKLREDPGRFVLLFELYALALRDEQIRVEVRAMLHDERVLLAETISALLGARPEKTGLSPEALASLTLAVADGVILQAMIDPTVKPGEYLMVLARAMAALIAK